MPDEPTQSPPARFLTLDQVAEELNTSYIQVRSLVLRGELKALRIGGRGQWRVERSKLEEYIEQAYADTATYLERHPAPADQDEPQPDQ